MLYRSLINALGVMYSLSFVLFVTFSVHALVMCVSVYGLCVSI